MTDDEQWAKARALMDAHILELVTEYEACKAVIKGMRALADGRVWTMVQCPPDWYPDWHPS